MPLLAARTFQVPMSTTFQRDWDLRVEAQANRVRAEEQRRKHLARLKHSITIYAWMQGVETWPTFSISSREDIMLDMALISSDYVERYDLVSRTWRRETTSDVVPVVIGEYLLFRVADEIKGRRTITKCAPVPPSQVLQSQTSSALGESLAARLTSQKAVVPTSQSAASLTGLSAVASLATTMSALSLLSLHSGNELSSLATAGCTPSGTPWAGTAAPECLQDTVNDTLHPLDSSSPSLPSPMPSEYTAQRVSPAQPPSSSSTSIPASTTQEESLESCRSLDSRYVAPGTVHAALRTAHTFLPISFPPISDGQLDDRDSLWDSGTVFTPSTKKPWPAESIPVTWHERLGCWQSRVSSCDVENWVWQGGIGAGAVLDLSPFFVSSFPSVGLELIGLQHGNIIPVSQTSFERRDRRETLRPSKVRTLSNPNHGRSYVKCTPYDNTGFPIHPTYFRYCNSELRTGEVDLSESQGQGRGPQSCSSGGPTHHCSICPSRAAKHCGRIAASSIARLLVVAAYILGFLPEHFLSLLYGTISEVYDPDLAAAIQASLADMCSPTLMDHSTNPGVPGSSSHLPDAGLNAPLPDDPVSPQYEHDLAIAIQASLGNTECRPSPQSSNVSSEAEEKSEIDKFNDDLAAAIRASLDDTAHLQDDEDASAGPSCRPAECSRNADMGPSLSSTSLGSEWSVSGDLLIMTRSIAPGLSTEPRVEVEVEINAVDIDIHVRVHDCRV
ncbi:hypothetical protein FKP32DRAFT_1602691 [Trametes sanguinea]|nr:hypothetical protein FKP32DRAFT_1602691 [Trametes sanguinea]